MRASVRALVLRPWFFDDDLKQENPRPTARGLYKGFCLPLAAGAALGFCGARGGSVWRLPLLCVCSDVSRRAASCARAAACAFGVSSCARGPLSIIARAPRRRCGRAPPETCLTVHRRRLGCVRAGWWRFGGQSDNLGERVCSLQDDVSEHAEGSLSAERSVRDAQPNTRGSFASSACRTVKLVIETG